MDVGQEEEEEEEDQDQIISTTACEKQKVVLRLGAFLSVEGLFSEMLCLYFVTADGRMTKQAQMWCKKTQAI